MSRYPFTSQTKSAAAATLQSQQSSLSRYVGFFAIGYVLASALFMLVQAQLPLNPQLITVLSVVVGAYIAVHKFVKHHQRALSSAEINRISIGGTIAVWLLTLIYFLGLWLWLFDAASREVLLEMTMQQPLPLVAALVMMLLLSAISARVAIWAMNRLLAPK